MPQSPFKHYPHILSPMQMLYNYTMNIKKAINQFFNQYLKPQGKDILLLFNRYMLIIVILNIDIRFLIMICVVVFVIVKLVKIRPWATDRKLNLPLSYVNKIYGIKRTKSLQNKKKSSSSNSLTNNFVQSRYSYHHKPRLPINCAEQKQQLLKKTNSDFIVASFTPQHIEQQIYKFINNLIQNYCKVIWYIKWKAIFILWACVLIVWVFQPSHQFDTFKISTKKDGAIQIGQIKKASEIINYFHLIMIWLLSNIVLFFSHGTKQLKRQIILEIYTNEYTIELLKKKKIRFSKSFTRTGNFLMESNNRQPHSPQFYSTFVQKKKAYSPVDLQKLKDFSSGSQQKSTPKFNLPEEGFSERKLSHDFPIVSCQSPYELNTNKEDTINQMFENSFVESQEYSQSDEQQKHEQKIVIKQDPCQIDTESKQKENDQQQINAINSSKIFKQVKKNPILQRKNTFLEGKNQQNLLMGSRQRKSSDELIKSQKYNDFKINLLKVPLTTSTLEKKK